MSIRAVTWVLAIVALAVGVWYWVQYVGVKIASTDYSTVPVASVLNNVLGIGVPQGLKGIRIGGHRGMGSSSANIWIKVRGSDKALSALTAPSEPLGPNLFHFTMPDPNNVVQKIGYADAVKGAWDEVPTLKNPETYQFRHQGSDGTWIGYILISKPKHIAYINAQTI